MATTLVVGLLVAFVATTVAAGVRLMPTRAHCPVCGGRTTSIQPHPAVRRAAPGLRGRWCASCAWEGVGREGPEFTPGRPISHDSGFRWGQHRELQDMGFRFGDGAASDTPDAPAPAEPPAHPSGFRFGGDDPPPTEDEEVGFEWRDGSTARRIGATPPQPAFEWADPRKMVGFRWAERQKGRVLFRWKDVG